MSSLVFTNINVHIPPLLERRADSMMSPLQYQKQLRLVAARERMLGEGIDAASAAREELRAFISS